MKHIFLVSLLCSFVAVSASLETNTIAQSVSSEFHPQKHKVPETVQLTTKIVSQQRCTQVVDPQNHYVKARLKLRLTVTNVSNEPIIIHRYGGIIYRVLLSKSLEKAKAKQYIYDEHDFMMRSYLFTRPDFLGDAPSDEFIILKPNDFHEYEYDRGVEISLTDLGDPTRSLRPGDYFLELKAETWQWGVEKAQELQKRWTKYGYFWYYDIKSLPTFLRIEKQSLTPPICHQYNHKKLR